MIHGHKPNGYVERAVSGDGVRETGETRQCCHCQFMWVYQPDWGKPKALRGWCLKHEAYICARPECLAEQERMLHHYNQATGRSYTCIAFEEYNGWLAESLFTKGRDWTINSSGLLVPKVD